MAPHHAARRHDRRLSDTDGATGADLRELVTLAVLHTASPQEKNVDGGRNAGVTTALLLRLAGEAGYHLPTGQYL